MKHLISAVSVSIAGFVGAVLIVKMAMDAAGTWWAVPFAFGLLILAGLLSRA